MKILINGLNNLKRNKMKKEMPDEIKDVLNFAAEKYSNSKATTNAGRILRLFARFITVDTVIKLFAHKVHK